MIQQVIVAVIVAAAVLHFCTKYLPAAWRRQIVYFLTKRGVDQEKAAKLFNTKSSGCGDGCSSCGSCETTPAETITTTTTTTPTAPLKRVIKLHVQR